MRFDRSGGATAPTCQREFFAIGNQKPNFGIQELFELCPPQIVLTIFGLENLIILYWPDIMSLQVMVFSTGHWSFWTSMVASDYPPLSPTIIAEQFASLPERQSSPSGTQRFTVSTKIISQVLLISYYLTRTTVLPMINERHLYCHEYRSIVPPIGYLPAVPIIRGYR